MFYCKEYGLLRKKMVYWGKKYGLLEKKIWFIGEKNKDVSFGLFAEKEALPIVNDEELNFDGETKVTKSGRTTGTTVGDLTDDSLTVRVDTSFLSRGYIAFFNCYAVENITEQNAFFRQGDSGSGVYVMEKDETLKPLGIAFASLFSQTAVCKIDSIIQKLDLKIVRYLDNKQTQLLMSQTENVTEKKLPEQEPMDCV